MAIDNLQKGQPKRVPKVRRRDRHDHRTEYDEKEVESENEDNPILVVELGRMRNRGYMHEKGPWSSTWGVELTKTWLLLRRQNLHSK